MATQGDIRCVTIEFLRFGGEEAILGKGNRYIRTAGYDETVSEIEAGLSQKDFIRNLARLRYRQGTAPEQADEARAFLAGHAANFLPGTLLASGKGLLQIDVVTKAAELWAFPFEAWLAHHPEKLDHPEEGVVITRRIRGDFSADSPPWPDIPKVLFVHAPVASDLEQSLIDQHQAVLCTALGPWAAGGDPIKKGLLTVCEAWSEEDLKEAMKVQLYSFIHILAHGAEVRGDVAEDRVWGLRLGSPAVSATHPKAIADVLRPRDGHPLVITIAACDSGNEGDPAMGNYSIVQELHRCGTPVVVGSQLPLTKPGSVAFTQAFYRPLLEGQDVRGALHAGRVAVRKSDAAGHDWLSIVAYVRLPPEGYAAHLLEFGLRAELGILKALQTEADDLNIGGGTEERFRAAEQLLAERIVALEVRLKKLREEETSLRQECGGLLASAHKRRAELLFTRADKFPAQRDQDLVASREALVRSLEAYRNTFQAFPQSHWNGMQQLALEVALNGRIANPGDWDLVRSFAERVRSSQPKDFWTLGTLVEALFIAPIAGKDRTLDAVQAAIAELRKRAGDKSFAVESTRRQIQRYATWWTHENGFFPGVPDLSADAKTILALLS